jgi:hypothetical protein
MGLVRGAVEECAVTTFVLTEGLSTSNREATYRNKTSLLVSTKSPALSL